MLENLNVNVQVKVAALWASVMFLYAYADIQHFVLQTGSLEEILGGAIGGIQITPIFLLGAAVLKQGFDPSAVLPGSAQTGVNEGGKASGKGTN